MNNIICIAFSYLSTKLESGNNGCEWKSGTAGNKGMVTSIVVDQLWCCNHVEHSDKMLDDPPCLLAN